MKYPLLLLLSAFLFYGCKKEEKAPTPPYSAPKNYPGTIRFENKSGFFFTIYIDGVDKGRLLGRESIMHAVTPGNHNCRVIQDTDTSMVTFDSTYTESVSSGEYWNISFP